MRPDRASRDGINERSRRKFDRLAREFPEHHERIKSGEGWGASRQTGARVPEAAGG